MWNMHCDRGTMCSAVAADDDGGGGDHGAADAVAATRGCSAACTHMVCAVQCRALCIFENVHAACYFIFRLFLLIWLCVQALSAISLTCSNHFPLIEYFFSFCSFFTSSSFLHFHFTVQKTHRLPSLSCLLFDCLWTCLVRTLISTFFFFSFFFFLGRSCLVVFLIYELCVWFFSIQFNFFFLFFVSFVVNCSR